MDEGGGVRLAPGVAVPASALTFTASRSGGPGGQHVNKTESRVELRLALAAIVGLSPGTRARLAALAGSRLTADGDLLLTCDETRSQRTNRDLVVERLSELVLAALVAPKPRKRTRPGRGAIERRLSAKARNADRKRDRRPDAE